MLSASGVCAIVSMCQWLVTSAAQKLYRLLPLLLGVKAHRHAVFHNIAGGELPGCTGKRQASQLLPYLSAVNNVLSFSQHDG